METSMKAILDKMDEMQREYQKQTKTLTESIANLSASIDEKLKPLVEENKQLKNEVEGLNKKVYHLEREVRKNNLIMHGLEENETNNTELLESVIACLNTTCKDTGLDNWDKYEISRVQRLGKKQSKKTRPILFTLTLEWRKLEILRNKKRFPANIYITEDYPKEILSIRKELKVKQLEEIKRGKIAFIRYDKLIVKDKNSAAKESEKRKRTATDSPKQQLNSKKNDSRTKINKTNSLGFITRPRDNSTPGSNNQ